MLTLQKTTKNPTRWHKLVSAKDKGFQKKAHNFWWELHEKYENELDKIEKLKYKELKNIIENYNDRNDDSIDVLNFLFENVSKIEVNFKKSLFIQNYVDMGV